MWAPAETPPMDTRVGLMLRVLDESRALVEASQPCTRPAHERTRPAHKDIPSSRPPRRPGYICPRWFLYRESAQNI